MPELLAKIHLAMVLARASSELSPKARQIERKLHQTIKRISEDFQGRWHFNTSVAAIMEFVNHLYAAEDEISSGKFPPALLADVQRRLVLLLAPFAPYLAAELWEVLGETETFFAIPGRPMILLWPKKTKSPTPFRSMASFAAT